MEDSFRKEFDQLRELGEQTFVLRGSTIIVEILPEPELKTAGGIVIATKSDHVKGNSVAAHKVDIGRVLMCGQGYWNDDRTVEVQTTELTSAGHPMRTVNVHKVPGYEALPVNPGAIVLLPQYSTSVLSMFPGINRPTGNKLAMVKMDDVLAYYPSEDAYQTAIKKLN